MTSTYPWPRVAIGKFCPKRATSLDPGAQAWAALKAWAFGAAWLG